ncbi:unnamed protein product [Owenia fusiformis]|uniref:Uncharacterized protein n=1 Tax=Owenia fusiformis TaxID=6347 RepID=A0A8J1TWA7_OWEFU|nr:unnamed protein product [Owenia fusiformis]
MPELLMPALVALIIIYIVIKFMTKKSIPKGPPQKWPFIGNAFEIDSQNPQETFINWSKKYGDVFSVKVFGEDIVIVNGFDAVYEALVTKSTEFAGRPKQFRVKLMLDGEYTGSCWDNWSNPKMRLLKKAAMRSMKQFGEGLDRLETISLGVIEELIGVLDSKEEQPFYPEHIINKATTCIILLYLFGEEYHMDHPHLAVLHKMLRYWEDSMGNASGLLLDIFPWLRFFGNKAYREISKAAEIRDSIFLPLIKKRKETIDKANPDCVCDALLLLQEEQRKVGKVITELDIKITLQDSFMGGVDTTTSAVTGMLLILMNYPEVQTKLQREIDGVIGTERPPSLADKSKMAYTEAFILEMLRYMSLAALGLPRATETDTTLRGHPLPKGIMVVLNLWSVHHDPGQWDDSFTLKPERFLNEDGTPVSPDHPNKRNFFPFGAGHRICIAQVLAKSRLFLFVTSLLQKFTFLPPEGTTPPSCDPRLFKRALILVPQPFQVRAIRWQQPDDKI